MWDMGAMVAERAEAEVGAVEMVVVVDLLVLGTVGMVVVAMVMVMVAVTSVRVVVAMEMVVAAMMMAAAVS